MGLHGDGGCCLVGFVWRHMGRIVAYHNLRNNTTSLQAYKLVHENDATRISSRALQNQEQKKNLSWSYMTAMVH